MMRTPARRTTVCNKSQQQNQHLQLKRISAPRTRVADMLSRKMSKVHWSSMSPRNSLSRLGISLPPPLTSGRFRSLQLSIHNFMQKARPLFNVTRHFDTFWYILHVWHTVDGRATKSNPCCIVVNPRTPKFQCCLWAARLAPVDKKIKPWTQRKLDRVLFNIEILGVGFYLVDVCRVWFFCPSNYCTYVWHVLVPKRPATKTTCSRFDSLNTILS